MNGSEIKSTTSPAEIRPKNGDEILYMDEFHDEASRPLTSNGSEMAALPSIGLRAGFGSEADEDPAANDSRSRRPSFAETEVTETEHDRNLGGKPLPLGGDNRNGPETLGEPQSWTSGFFPPTVQVVTPDVNIYQHKKTLAQGMMDLALLSANANQMRYVLQTTGQHPYFYPSLTMIGMSLFLQIAVGIGLIWNSVYNVKEHEQMCKANRANNWTVIGIFLVTILNVFISSFGVVDQVSILTSGGSTCEHSAPRTLSANFARRMAVRTSCVPSSQAKAISASLLCSPFCGKL